MSKTLSEMFQDIAKFKLDCGKVAAIEIYMAQDDCLGDNKVLGVTESKMMDLHRLVHVVMRGTDRLYHKYKNYDVVVSAHDGDVYKVWIKK